MQAPQSFTTKFPVRGGQESRQGSQAGRQGLFRRRQRIPERAGKSFVRSKFAGDDIAVISGISHETMRVKIASRGAEQKS
jgi:hypothetical protein